MGRARASEVSRSGRRDWAPRGGGGADRGAASTALSTAASEAEASRRAPGCAWQLYFMRRK